MGQRNGGREGYQNVTFTDAQLSCDKEAKHYFGSTLARLVPDDHSSRFEHELYMYKIFMQAYVKRKSKANAKFYVSCFVTSFTGEVERFEAFEEQEVKNGGAASPVNEKFIEWPR